MLVIIYTGYHARCHHLDMGIFVYPLGSHKSICGLSDTGMFLCVVIVMCVSNCVCLFIQLPLGLTISEVSSLRDGSVSVGWGLRAESLLLLTSRGVSVENTRTHTNTNDI